MSLALAGGFFTTSTTCEALLKLAISMATFRANVQRSKYSASSFSSYVKAFLTTLGYRSCILQGLLYSVVRLVKHLEFCDIDFFFVYLTSSVGM